MFLIGGGLATVSIVALVTASKRFSDTPLQKIRNVHLPAGQKIELDEPQISGWVAWWKEEEAHALIASNPEKLQTVSPVWFLIDEQFKLKEVGEYGKEQALLTLRASGLRVIPTALSEINLPCQRSTSSEF